MVSKKSQLAPKDPSYIDLFAGCGGLSYGLMQAGWRGLFAVERSDMAFATLRHNLISKHNHFLWPDWLPQRPYSIETLLRSYRSDLQRLRGRVPLVVGGPPCQGFSTAGMRQESDQRNSLVMAYLRFVSLVEPDFILFENVRGITMPFSNSDLAQTSYADRITKRLRRIGYMDAAFRLVDFSDFGVPQKRVRFILVASRHGFAHEFFEYIESCRAEFLKEKGLRASTPTRFAIGDLECKHGTMTCDESPSFDSGMYGRASTNYQRAMRDSEGFPNSHRFARHTQATTKTFERILKHAVPNERIQGEARKQFDLKKRNATLLDGDSPSPTLLSIPDDYIHYSEPRILTVREYARLQSFPDSFVFKGNYTTGGPARRTAVPRYTQIANAIPPLFAELAGRVLKSMVSNE